MKKTLLFTLFIGLVYLTSSSYSDGPAENLKPTDGYRTGAPGSNGTCSDAANGCHGAASANTAVDITIQEEGTSTPVADGKYKPLRKYTVKLTGTHSSLTHFGFQCNVLNSSNTKTGLLKTTAINQQVETVGGIDLIEHATTINGPGGTFTTEFEWISPHAGTGDVTFYAMVNAVNDDSDEANDEPSAPFSITFNENTSASVQKLFRNVTVNMHPNPFTNTLQIKLTGAQTGEYQVNVFDLHGRNIYTENVKYTGNNMSIDTKDWSKGLYMVQIIKDNADKLVSVVKQ